MYILSGSQMQDGTGQFGETVNDAFPVGCCYALISDAASRLPNGIGYGLLDRTFTITFTTFAVDATVLACDGEVSWTSGRRTGLISSELFWLVL